MTEETPRAWTEEEMRKAYLDLIAAYCHYWADLSEEEGGGTLQRLQGLAFSILVMLDGESPLPGCHVIPAPHVDDREWHIGLGENWYPQGKDIAGPLHEYWARRRDQVRTGPNTDPT